MLYAGGMTCEQCGGKVAVPERQGRPARFCSNACRQRAYRARRSGVPACMRERVRWVRWVERARRGKTTKVPLDLAGRDLDVRDSRRWVSFEDARRSWVGTGVGIVLGGVLGGVDLNDCVVGGVIADWAERWCCGCREDAVLIERWVSGRGVDIFLPLAEALGRRIRHGVENVEISSRGRYVAVTVDRL